MRRPVSTSPGATRCPAILARLAGGTLCALLGLGAAHCGSDSEAPGVPVSQTDAGSEGQSDAAVESLGEAGKDTAVVDQLASDTTAPESSPPTDSAKPDVVTADGGVCATTDDLPVLDVAKAKTYAETATTVFHTLLTRYQGMAKLATLYAGSNNKIDDLYNLQNVFHGMLGVYEVTGDETILSELFGLALDIVAAGVDVDKDGYLDYCCRDDNGNPIVCGFDDDHFRKCDNEAGMMPTYPWRSLRGTAAVLRAVAGSSLLNSRKADFDKLREFVKHDVIDKWLDLDGTGPDTGLKGTGTAGILSRMAGILTDYYLATGDQAMGALAQEWTVLISTDMEPSPKNPKAYAFDNVVNAPSFGSPADTPHANEVVIALIEGVEAGFLPCDFLVPLQATFLEIMWNKDSANPMFAHFVDGSGALEANPVVGGFIRLGQFKGATQALTAKIQYHSSGDYDSIQYNGNMARNYGLALKTYPLVPLSNP